MALAVRRQTVRRCAYRRSLLVLCRHHGAANADCHGQPAEPPGREPGRPHDVAGPLLLRSEQCRITVRAGAPQLRRHVWLPSHAQWGLHGPHVSILVL